MLKSLLKTVFLSSVSGIPGFAAQKYVVSAFMTHDQQLGQLTSAVSSDRISEILQLN